MNMLMSSRITVKRQEMALKEGTKIPQMKARIVYEGLPARINDFKLFLKIRQPGGTEIAIQKNDIIVDETTGFKYIISSHPQWGGGKKHHWEAPLEVLVNE